MNLRLWEGLSAWYELEKLQSRLSWIAMWPKVRFIKDFFILYSVQCRNLGGNITQYPIYVNLTLEPGSTFSGTWIFSSSTLRPSSPCQAVQQQHVVVRQPAPAVAHSHNVSPCQLKLLEQTLAEVEVKTTVQSTTVQSTLFKVPLFKIPLFKVHCSKYHCSKYTVQSTTLQSTLFKVHCSKYHCSKYHCSKYTVQSTLFKVPLFKVPLFKRVRNVRVSICLCWTFLLLTHHSSGRKGR